MLRAVAMNLRLLALAAAFSAASAHATHYTWAAAVSGNWFFNPGAWSPNGTPSGVGDTVTIDAVGNPYTVTLNASPSVDWLLIDSNDATISSLLRTWNIGTVTHRRGKVNFRSSQINGGTTTNEALWDTLGNSSVNSNMTNAAGAELRVLGALDGGHSTATYANLQNDGLMRLTSQDGTWWAHVAGQVTNNASGRILTEVGAGGTRRFTGNLLNRGQIESNAYTEVFGPNAVFQMRGGSLTGTDGFFVSFGNYIVEAGQLNSLNGVINGDLRFENSTATGAIDARGNADLFGTINDGVTLTVRGANNGGHATLRTSANTINRGTILLDSQDDQWWAHLDATAGLRNEGTIRVLPGTGSSRQVNGTIFNFGTLDGTQAPMVLGGSISLSAGSLQGDVIGRGLNATFTANSTSTGQLISEGTTNVVSGIIPAGMTLWVRGGETGHGTTLSAGNTTVNRGTLRMESVASAWWSRLSGQWRNEGLMIINRGTGGDRTIQGTFTNSGQMLIDRGARMEGNFSMLGGSISVGNEGFINFGGASTFLGGTSIGPVGNQGGILNIPVGSTFIGDLISKQETTFEGEVRQGNKLTNLGSTFGGHSTLTAAAGSGNRGRMEFTSELGAWWSRFNMPSGFTNYSTGVMKNLTGEGGDRNWTGTLTNFGTLDGTERSIDLQGRLDMLGGQTTGRVRVLGTSILNFGNSSNASGRIEVASARVMGAVPQGTELWVRGSQQNSSVRMESEGAATNNGLIRLESTDGPFDSNAGGNWINGQTGRIVFNAGSGGGRVWNSRVQNHGLMDFNVNATVGVVGQENVNFATGVFDLGAANVTSIGNRFVNRGLVKGTGRLVQVEGASFVNEGVVAPGTSPGVMAITRTFAQAQSGVLQIELGGRTVGQYDRLSVEGRAELGGTLQVSFFGGFTATAGDRFRVLVSGERVGQFAVVPNSNQWRVIYGNTFVDIEAVPEPATMVALALGAAALVRRRRTR